MIQFCLVRELLETTRCDWFSSKEKNQRTGSLLALPVCPSGLRPRGDRGARDHQRTGIDLFIGLHPPGVQFGDKWRLVHWELAHV